MPVPIINLKISDIVTELGEQSSNVKLQNLHRSSKVMGIGIDPVYCDGSNPYQRLYSLQKNPTIGKFRNYEQFNYFYRSGLLYGGNCIYPREVNRPTIHIPSGWRLPTQDDWLNIIQTIQPGTTFTTNTIAHHLRSNYDRTDIVNFNNTYYTRTGEWLIRPGYPAPIFEDSVLKSDTYNFKAIASAVIDIFGANSIGRNWFCWTYDSSIMYNSNILPCVTLNGNFHFPEALASSTVGFTGFYDSFDGRSVMMSIRLVKNDSVNPGYMEDIEGNIYQTIKIGDIVIMAEGYRCTKDINGDPMLSYTIGGGLPPGAYYYKDSLISDMP